MDPDKYKLINKENLQSLQFKYSLAQHLVDAVHDLVVSPTTFERDFESHFLKIISSTNKLSDKRLRKI